MNFSGISYQSPLGKLLRSPLQWLPKEMQMTILQGKLKGKRWTVGSSQHGCWLGSYEYDKQQLLEQTIAAGSIVFDLGAHVGFHTLLASALVGSSGRVFAFEPMPKNLHYLKQHLKMNQIQNVTVIEAAISDTDGVASFDLAASSFHGHLAAQGSLQVRTISLDSLLNQGEIPLPDYIKMDVEGAEVAALQGMRTILEQAHPTIVLATHGDEIQQQCRELLTAIGYQFQVIGDKPLESADELLVYHPSRGVHRVLQ
ncbi:MULTISPECIES: FkbM family methyltransferase [unclassified Leptolyngbya]|uniref:FkbM family methyltransferase n=1 Tax=unclassified Leptolyngbya TaxID=2650499 RepID=UPI001ACCC985|nr:MULTISPECIES: FkbM family methyltransferase [unclassified Leptolyngbya]MBN8559321.1 FkbM family methyltransferase [Leptolyngbya sp. UWPOB_LEPTO1]MCY6489315.1 FkbM family methyltransferase [Leptolyngbya sp. GGD]